MSTRHQLRRLGASATAAVLGLLLAGAAPVAADAATRHVRIEIDESFVDEGLSDACGTEVRITTEASLNVMLRYNRSGALVAEIDPAGGGKVMVTAPATGGSFSIPFNTTIIDYGSGAAVGSSFTMRIVGLAGHVPGFIESDAGHLILAGVVEGFDEYGLPHLHITDFVALHGHVTDGDVVAAACSALAG